MNRSQRKKAKEQARARFQPELVDFRAIPPEKLGKMIVRRREYLGMNQKQFAALADITPAALCRIEKGQATPQTTTLTRICAKLQCSLTQLIYPVEPQLADNKPASHSGRMRQG